MRSIVDQRLITGTQAHHESVCTIYDVIITASSSGQRVETLGDPVDGMRHIPCRLAPLIEIRPTDNENRTNRVQSEYANRVCRLNGHFPDIEVRRHRAVVDNVEWNIRGIEHDGSRKYTRLRLEVIKP